MSKDLRYIVLPTAVRNMVTESGFSDYEEGIEFTSHDFHPSAGKLS